CTSGCVSQWIAAWSEHMTTDQSDIVERLLSVDGIKDAGVVIDLCWEAAAEIERLRAALAAAKTKLKLYRAQHSGEYIGGMEYGMLLDMINEVLGESKYDR